MQWRPLIPNAYEKLGVVVLGPLTLLFAENGKEMYKNL